MTEEEFKLEMKKRGWNDDEIKEMYNDDGRLLLLPFECLLQDKPKIRTYYINESGNIVDEE